MTAVGGELTRLLQRLIDGGEVFVQRRPGISADLVNDSARVAGWCAGMSVLKEHVEWAQSDVKRSGSKSLSCFFFLFRCALQNG